MLKLLLLNLLITLGWSQSALAQEDETNNSDESGSQDAPAEEEQSAGLPDNQKDEALKMPSLSRSQHEWLEPKRSKLPQIPHAQTDFTAYTLEWGETKMGLASITVGALPNTQLGTIPALDILGLYNGHLKVNAVKKGPYAVGIGTNYYALNAGDMNASSLGISLIQSVEFLDPWSGHFGIKWSNTQSSGVPDLDELPSIFTSGTTAEEFEAGQRESKWEFHIQELTLSLATDYRFNRRDSLIFQASAVFWSNVLAGERDDVPPILGMDQLFNKSVGTSSPIAQTYVASLAWQWSWRKTDLRVGIGHSNVPGAWLLQTFDLSYRFGGKTRSTERRMNKTWRRNKSDTQGR